MQLWEYRVILQTASKDPTIVAKNEDKLKQLGLQGWEVVGTMQVCDQIFHNIILKRPKQE